MLPRRLLAIPALLALAAAAAGDDWPAYRGPTGDGHAAKDAHPPTAWGENQNVRWKTEIHGKGWSSPVVLGRQIWMTTASDDGKARSAVCVDRDTGKVVHDVKVFDVPEPEFIHAFNSYASPTPALEAGRVYVHFGSVGTACLDAATGKTLWERRDLPCDHFRGAGSSPILHGNLLIVPFDGADVQYVVALDKATGRTAWKTDRNTDYANSDGDWHKAFATAAVLPGPGREELVVPSSYVAVAYDPASGRELWRVVTGGMNAACRPFVTNGLVILTNGMGGLSAVRPGGTGDVTASRVAWKASKSVPTRSTPIAVDGVVYYVHESGVLTAVDAATGKELKKERLGGDNTASPVYAGGHLYFFDQSGQGHVVKPGRDFKIVSANRLDSGCMASPAAVGGALFVRTKTHLYRIEGQ